VKEECEPFNEWFGQQRIETYNIQSAHPDCISTKVFEVFNDLAFRFGRHAYRAEFGLSTPRIHNLGDFDAERLRHVLEPEPVARKPANGHVELAKEALKASPSLPDRVQECRLRTSNIAIAFSGVERGIDPYTEISM
jgi:hypothetical protein